MAKIKDPVLPAIDPNCWLEGERALHERFTEIADSHEPSTEALKALIVEAIEAGWTDNDVRRAFLDMIRAKEAPGNSE